MTISPSRAVALMAAVAMLPAPAFAAAEDDVKAVFTDFQKAVKTRDPEKIWPLLDTSTQKAADKEAASIKAEYDKAPAKKKEQLEKALGLSAADLEKLTGKSYLKSAKFHARNHEIPGSKVMKVTVDGDKATVFYEEEDGDKEKLELVRQDGKWKVIVKVA